MNLYQQAQGAVKDMDIVVGRGHSGGKNNITGRAQ